jgi:isopenicillin N synthase-like dioxygenase
MLEQFDLTELATATSTGDRDTLARLDRVCREVGAFALSGVDLTDGLIDRVHEDTLELFRLPLDAKSRLQPTDGDQFVGWKGSSDNRNEFGFPDNKEMFHIGPRVDPTLAGPDRTGVVPDGSPEDGADCPLWPAELPGFSRSWHAYYRAMQQAGTALGLAMAAALGVESSTWLDLVADNWADLAANYYPPVGAGTGVRNAVHSDLTMFTILYQDTGGGGGLHMQARDGEWLAVPPRDDVYLVNVGELLSYLTGGRWWAVPHEVSEADPTAPGADTARISIPFFYRPNDDRTIVPLLDTAPDAAPIEVGDWVRNRKLLAAAR